MGKLKLTLLGCARGWAPLGTVGLFLKMCARDELPGQILGIFHDGRDDEVRDPIGFIRAVVILGENRISPIRHAVLSKIARAQMGGDNFERTSASGTCRSRRSPTSAAAAAGHLP